MRIATLKDGSRHLVFDKAEEITKWKDTLDIEIILRSECIYKETCKGICAICENFIHDSHNES